MGMLMWYRNVAGVVIFFFSLLLGNVAPAQINISPDQTAQALAQQLAGQGVTILNPTLNCPSRANGFFKTVNSSLGLDSGIVLTTGLAATKGNAFGVDGPSSRLASNDNGASGDPMLDPLAGQRTVDACSLEFDVIPNGDTIKFSYVFSSEEYINSVCGPYNDAFAFFISGAGIFSYENMAVVPGTGIPVTINSINNGIPGKTGTIRNCTDMGAGSPFTTFYIDNATGQTLTHQGLTSVLQAIHAVTPCSTYHLKIVIADSGDPLYDSGVFLKAGSLQTSSFYVNTLAVIPSDTQSSFCVKGCLPGVFQVRRTQASSSPQTIKFTTKGSAVSGIDFVPFADSVVIPANQTTAQIRINGLPTFLSGVKTLQLLIKSPYVCTGVNNIVDSASMLIYDTVHMALATHDTVVCANTLTQLQVYGDDIFSYRWSPASGLSDCAIKDPVASPSEKITYVVTVSLPGTNCPAKSDEINFTIKSTPHIELAPDTSICFNTSFGLSAQVSPANEFYNYHWVGPAEFTSSLPTPVISNVPSVQQGIYTLSVVNDTNNCSDVASIDITVITPALPGISSPVILCQNKTSDSLSATGTDLLWYDAAGLPLHVAPVPPTDELALLVYFVSQSTGNCESPKKEVDVEVKKCCDGNIFIPTAFTPNGDGRNDIFRPMEDYGYFIYSMAVFNRWGQIVYSGGTHSAWDGKFNGVSAESGTYYYIITFGCILGGNMKRTGDVTLIR